MIADVSGETFDQAFMRVRDMDASLDEQLRAFSDAARQKRPDFAAAVDRLVERLRRYGAGDAAPQPGEPMPPFVLPDDSGRMASLDRLLTHFRSSTISAAVPRNSFNSSRSNRRLSSSSEGVSNSGLIVRDTPSLSVPTSPLLIADA